MAHVRTSFQSDDRAPRQIKLEGAETSSFICNSICEGIRLFLQGVDLCQYFLDHFFSDAGVYGLRHGKQGF